MKVLCAAVFAALATPAWSDPAAVAALAELRGRSDVAWSPRLEAIARTHADDMLARRVMRHHSANGDGPGDRATRAGYRWCMIAENVAYGQRSTAEVMRAWSGSPSHRRSRLSGGLKPETLHRTS